MPQSDPEYDQLLGDFRDLCTQLKQQGMPYLVVILCHELYRFLYPVEPYANFVNRDPVPFGLRHIRQLIELGRSWSQVVAPYGNVFGRFDAARWHGDRVEMTTSNLYSDLWKDFDEQTRTQESVALLRGRLPAAVIEARIVGKRVLDMGCGSGRYTIAIAKSGAAHATGVDVQAKAFAASQQWCREQGLPVEFRESHVHQLPFADESFDFVFCNGVLHHTSFIERGLAELARVVKRSGAAFLYLYGAGGFFWKARVCMREIFRDIPLDYTKQVLATIGMPSNRFIFCDTWYVPIEGHIGTDELIRMLDAAGFSYEKIVGQARFDLDGALAADIPGAETAWGNGEHRYLLKKI
jgi:ubiquinone/menaquinone biosynthesis C-methylase UbiE